MRKKPRKIRNFNDVRKYLETPGNAGKNVLKAFETITDAAVIFSPVFFGPEFLTLLNVLDVKDRLFDACYLVYDFIVEKIQPDYITRAEQLKTAYALISVTAYLEELSDAIPKRLIEKIKQEAPNLNLFIDDVGRDYENVKPYLTITDYYTDHEISFAEVKDHLFETYIEASTRLVDLINKISSTIGDNYIADCYDANNLIKKLPRKAIERFENQYIGLAIKFNDFALFAQIQMLERIDNTGYENKKALERLETLNVSIDVGLKKIKDIVSSFATTIDDRQVKKIVDDLKLSYANSIQKPIIDQREIKTDDNINRIVFPKIVDAFIPQSYKVLSYNDNSIELEDKKNWDSLPEQHDLDRFFIKYLFSPDSIDYPLIILGQPGSGKSLLTKVLSAQLMSDSYTVIRIPLREVNADLTIDKLVDQQINTEINRPLPLGGYGEFADSFKGKPLVIILDGYDELLQAKGKVFSGYLDSVHMFQKSQKALNRPVRIIVTSRITLIDKAQIPLNSTVLRLLEFDTNQQKKWISIWNKTNESYFANGEIRPFKLPESKNVLELAEQPLLLLMLALYDSDKNELVADENIKRTELYDNLIRKFLRRERRRYIPEFDEMLPEEQDRIVDEGMKRLGVVAIGMFNRKTVVIRSKQLESDLKTFKTHRENAYSGFHPLSDSDSLLGGFFFVHESIAKDTDSQRIEYVSAYEFLHNTFGEFLAADFILRNTNNTVVNVYRNRNGDIDLESFVKNDWFYCLMYVPLYTRPVVIEMMREHLDRSLENNLNRKSSSDAISRRDYCFYLKKIVNNQLQMVLKKSDFPDVMLKENPFNYNMSLLGILSTYSLNLIILACALDSNGYEFDEENYINVEDQQQNEEQVQIGDTENCPWTELTSLWKMWFSHTELLGVTTVFKAKRISRTKVWVRCEDEFKSTPDVNSIDVLLCISNALDDNYMVGLSGLHSKSFNEITQIKTLKKYKEFRNINSDIYFLHLVKLLRNQSDHLNSIEDILANPSIVLRVNEIIQEIVSSFPSQMDYEELDYGTKLMLVDILTECVLRKIVYLTKRADVCVVLHSLSGPKESLSYRINKIPFHASYTSFPVELKNLTGQLSLFDSIYQTDPLILLDTPRVSNSDLMRAAEIYKNDFEDNTLTDEDIAFCWRTASRFKSLRQNESNLISSIFTNKSLDVLVKTNPELLFHLLKELLTNSFICPRFVIDKIIDLTHRSLELIRKCDLRVIRIDVINDIVFVAKQVFADEFMKEFFVKLNDLLVEPRNYIIDKVLFLNPRIASELIELLPKTFDPLMKEKLEMYYKLPNYTYPDFLLSLDPTRWADYLRVLFYISKIVPDDEIVSREIKECIEYLTRIDLLEVEISTMSTEQVDLLLKCARYVDNSALIRKLLKIKHKSGLKNGLIEPLSE